MLLSIKTAPNNRRTRGEKRSSNNAYRGQATAGIKLINNLCNKYRKRNQEVEYPPHTLCQNTLSTFWTGLISGRRVLIANRISDAV